MLILAGVAVWFTLAAVLLAFCSRAGASLNHHVEPALETEAVVVWGPWASHGARCSCNVCR